MIHKQKTFAITLLLTLVIPLISAQSFGNIERGSFGAAQLFVSLFGPFFTALLGGGTELLFERILIFLIITSIVYMVVKEMNLFRGNKAIVTIITFSVSLLAVRFGQITELVYSILLPYQILGVTLSAFLPLIIGFFFIQRIAENSSFLRKTFWVFMTVVYIAMWSTYASQVGGYGWMYFWSALLCVAFLLLDGTIRRAIVKSRMEAANANSAEDYSRKIRRELAQLERDRTNGHVTDRMYRKIKRRLNNQLEGLLKF